MLHSFRLESSLIGLPIHSFAFICFKKSSANFTITGYVNLLYFRGNLIRKSFLLWPAKACYALYLKNLFLWSFRLCALISRPYYGTLSNATEYKHLLKLLYCLKNKANKKPFVCWVPAFILPFHMLCYCCRV